MKHRPALDVSHLATYAFGPRSPIWWGTLAFVVIESLGFLFAIVTYFYLQTQNKVWPPGVPPALLWGSLVTLLLLASELPNVFTKRAAKKMTVRRIRIGLVIMSLIGLAAIILRVFEFTTLNTRWDSNAYGSVIWVLLGLHTFHLVTDVFETLVFTVMFFVSPVDARRCSDIEDNQAYWDFVVLAWVPIYIVLYWAPRIMGTS
jgi:heme/copper-type cytochrome/quinol oxidase subunit 3